MSSKMAVDMPINLRSHAYCNGSIACTETSVSVALIPCLIIIVFVFDPCSYDGVYCWNHSHNKWIFAC